MSIKPAFFAGLGSGRGSRLKSWSGWSLGCALAVCLVGAAWLAPNRASEPATKIPAPAMDVPADAAKNAGLQTAVLAGGCFWGVQAVFQHVKGVTRAVSGYAGGAKDTASYQVVSSGGTGHAESVQITFDPREISYGRILQVYFSVAHDPTQLDRQGPDFGPQYRSAIFYGDEAQKKVAQAYIAQLNGAGVFKRPIVTQLNPLTGFYPAEDYHQDYATLHPNSPYIAFNDLPKVENLQRVFGGLYREKPVLVFAANQTN
jgi:peptide-methionine (S)-S-oxide reductase